MGGKEFEEKSTYPGLEEGGGGEEEGNLNNLVYID